MGSRAAAEQALRGMQRARLLSVVVGSPDADPAGCEGPSGGAGLLRLVADAPRPRLGQPLNAHFAWAGAARPALQVRSIWVDENEGIEVMRERLPAQALHIAYS